MAAAPRLFFFHKRAAPSCGTCGKGTPAARLYLFRKSDSFPFCLPLLFRLAFGLQNAVYILPDNIVLPDLFFQLAIIGIKTFFLFLQLFIFRLEGGDAGELAADLRRL